MKRLISDAPTSFLPRMKAQLSPSILSLPSPLLSFFLLFTLQRTHHIIYRLTSFFLKPPADTRYATDEELDSLLAEACAHIYIDKVSCPWSAYGAQIQHRWLYFWVKWRFNAECLKNTTKITKTKQKKHQNLFQLTV